MTTPHPGSAPPPQWLFRRSDQMWMSLRGRSCCTCHKMQYQGRDLLHLLHLRRMSRVWHEFHPRTRDAADELPGVYGRYEGVLLTPDHERRGLHAMDAMLEPLVRDGPDKLGRTS